VKVGIIGGAGTLGSSIAFYLATKNIVEEIVLLDVKENMLKAHVMDMEQAISALNSTAVSAGDWEALQGCHIVVMAASVPERNAPSRVEYLGDNLKIVRSVAGQIARYCPDALVINATNPVDVCNYILWDLTGMLARQFIGFSRNDSLRFRWAIGKVLETPVTDVDAMVVGEHGEAQVPLFSRVTVKGKAVELNPTQKAEVDKLIRTWFTTYVSLNSGRSSGWTSAVTIGQIIGVIGSGREEVLACSAILDGQYGLSGISIGVPILLGRQGIAQIVELPLSREEIIGLQAAAKKTKELIERVRSSL
jgi:malate/lactate dehydrogenase